MPKVTLSHEEIRTLVSWLKSKRTREMKKLWGRNYPTVIKLDSRIKLLENLK